MSEVKTLEDLQKLIRDTEEIGTIEARWEAVAAVDPKLVQQLSHSSFESISEDHQVIASGTPASPGAASGLLCLSADMVLSVDEGGEETILVSSETTPADEIGMRLAAGIVTARGGISSHAAVIARGWGIPAVVGVPSLQIKEKSALFGEIEIKEGEPISLDGATGEIFLGSNQVEDSEQVPEIEKLLNF